LAVKIIWELLTYGEYTDYRIMLSELYLTQQWGMEQIGEHLGIDKAVVRGELVRLKIPIRPKGRPRFKEKQIKASILLDLNKCTLATLSITRKAIKH
jgi:hypothetical protein